MSLMPLLNSWRTAAPRQGAESALPGMKKARNRLSTFTNDDLLAYIEGNIGGLMRNIRDYRNTSDEAHLDLALIANTTERAAIEELRHRRRTSGFG